MLKEGSGNLDPKLSEAGEGSEVKGYRPNSDLVALSRCDSISINNLNLCASVSLRVTKERCNDYINRELDEEQNIEAGVKTPK